MMNFLLSAVVFALWTTAGFAVLSLVVIFVGLIISALIWVCSQIGKLFRRMIK